VGNVSGYEKGFALGVKHGAEINQEVQASSLVSFMSCAYRIFIIIVNFVFFAG